VIWLILLVTVVLVMLALVCLLAWIALCRWWEERAERARIERDVRLAERHLHNLASRAFGSMLDLARQRRDQGPTPLQ
jgi:hypothetical protein